MDSALNKVAMLTIEIMFVESPMRLASNWYSPQPTKKITQPATTMLVVLLRFSLLYMNVYANEIEEKMVAATAKVMSIDLICPASDHGSIRPDNWLKARK